MVSAANRYVLFAPRTLTRCFDALTRSESAIQIQMRPKIPLTRGIGHLLEKATGHTSTSALKIVMAQPSRKHLHHRREHCQASICLASRNDSAHS
jgi:hypothetical protein